MSQLLQENTPQEKPPLFDLSDVIISLYEETISNLNMTVKKMKNNKSYANEAVKTHTIYFFLIMINIINIIRYMMTLFLVITTPKVIYGVSLIFTILCYFGLLGDAVRNFNRRLLEFMEKRNASQQEENETTNQVGDAREENQIPVINVLPRAQIDHFDFQNVGYFGTPTAN